MFDEKYSTFSVIDGKVYTCSDGKDQLLDIYIPDRPDGDNSPLPVLIWVHGGGLHSCDRKQRYVAEFCRRFSLKGYICFSADYRLAEKPVNDMESGKKALFDAAADVKEAVNWVCENAAGFGGDPGRIGLCGGSAGGFIANTLCYGDGNIFPLCERNRIKALASLWGAPEFDCVPRQSGPAALYMHGTEDQLVPFEYSVKWSRTLSAAGIPCIMMPLLGGKHTCMNFINEMDAIMRTFFAYHLV